MADIKISQLTAKGAKVENTDRIPIADFNGTTYDTRYVTGAEINELSLDTSPQLGGNLDVNGNQITSSSNGNIVINPNGTGVAKVESDLDLRDTAGATAKQIKLYEGFSNGSNYVGLKAPDSLSSDTTYTLPTADGTNGQILSTNGSGVLSWSTASGGGGVPTSRTISTTAPLSGGGDLTADRTLSIADAVADGTTKGAATFTANDFNATSGVISIDYTNGQSASASNKGFLTSSDWTIFNGKQNALGFTPEDVANKSTSVVTDQASNTKYPSVKAVYDWVTGLGYLLASTASSTYQTLSNLVTSFGGTPSDTKYPSEKLVKDSLDAKVTSNSLITGATKTKITYDSKGLVTSGEDATTADIADSTNKRYVTDANLTVIGNTSGTNTGDQNLFSTIAVAGQSNVVADSTSDTLTLVAGTNVTITTNATNDEITINSTGGGSGLTVGTTAITGGTVGRVLFEGTGNVLQEDSALFWDNTNKRLGVGATPDTSTRLDIRAQGALTTDIAFRIRNSANNANLATINGAGDITLGSGAAIITGSGGDGAVIAIGQNAAVNSGFTGHAIAIGRNASSNGSSIAIGNGASVGTGQTTNNNIAIGTSATTLNTVSKCIVIGQSTTTGQTEKTLAIGSDINFSGYLGRASIAIGYNFTGVNFIENAYAFGNATSAGATLDIGNSFSVYINRTTRSFFVNQNSNLVFRTNATLTSGTHFDASATNTITLHNGTAPASNITDAFQQYSADITAGNAAPHFRTENGDIVKLYRVGGWGLPTGTFTRTTFDTTTVTTAQLAERVAALIQDLRDNHGLLKA